MTLTTKNSQYELTSALAPLVVVSCDSHVGPSLAQMREYCPCLLYTSSLTLNQQAENSPSWYGGGNWEAAFEKSWGAK